MGSKGTTEFRRVGWQGLFRRAGLGRAKRRKLGMRNRVEAAHRAHEGGWL